LVTGCIRFYRLQLQQIASVVPSSPILVTLMTEAIHSSETPVHTTTRRQRHRVTHAYRPGEGTILCLKYSFALNDVVLQRAVCPRFLTPFACSEDLGFASFTRMTKGIHSWDVTPSTCIRLHGVTSQIPLPRPDWKVTFRVWPEILAANPGIPGSIPGATEFSE
jgi:hypothetical protein